MQLSAARSLTFNWRAVNIIVRISSTFQHYKFMISSYLSLMPSATFIKQLFIYCRANNIIARIADTFQHYKLHFSSYSSLLVNLMQLSAARSLRFMSFTN